MRRQARRDLPRRRRARAPGRHAARARRACRLRRVLSPRRAAIAAPTGWSKRCASGASHALTLTSSEGLDNCWRARRRDGARALLARVPRSFRTRASPSTRAAIGLDAIVDGRRRRGPHRRIARMVRRPTARRPGADPMPSPDIIVTAPLPPFLYEPLKADYRCHDYHAAATSRRCSPRRARASAASCRAAARSTPTSLLDALPKLEIISVFGVGYDGVPVDYCQQARHQGHEHAGRADRRRRRRRGRPGHDDRTRLRARSIASCAAGEWEKRGPELTTKLGGKTRRHPRPRPHRQGDRRRA